MKKIFFLVATVFFLATISVSVAQSDFYRVREIVDSGGKIVFSIADSGTKGVYTAKWCFNPRTQTWEREMIQYGGGDKFVLPVKECEVWKYISDLAGRREFPSRPIAWQDVDYKDFRCH